MPVRILIADDHGLVRAGLHALLNTEPEMKVVGEAATGDEALRLAAALRPDVLLIDLSMPGPDGIEVARQLRETLPQVRTLVLTIHEDPALLHAALRAGAAGYILKRAVEAELVDAILAVRRGELYIHPAMTRALLDGLALAPEGAAALTGALTVRECDVLRLVAQGYTNRQAAAALKLSVRTVETHRANLMNKLNRHSRAELVRYAADHGLLE